MSVPKNPRSTTARFAVLGEGRLNLHRGILKLDLSNKYRVAGKLFVTMESSPSM